MLAGTFYYILIFSVGSSRVNAASEITTDDLRFRVALIYGDSMQTDFRSRADNGFTLGFNTGNEFTAVTATSVTLVRFSIDANLTADASGRYPETILTTGWLMWLRRFRNTMFFPDITTGKRI